MLLPAGGGGEKLPFYFFAIHLVFFKLPELLPGAGFAKRSWELIHFVHTKDLHNFTLSIFNDWIPQRDQPQTRDDPGGQIPGK